MKTKKKEEKNQIKKEDFAISYVSREDLKDAGFDVSNIDDDTMIELSSEMGDAYNNFDFWSDLKDIAGRLGIPKQK